MMGLLKAIEKFDVDAGFRFSTYAGQWVRNGITRAYQKGEFNLAVSNPVHIAKIKYQLNRISKIHDVNIDNCYDMYVLDCERQEIQCLYGKATVKAAYELMTCSFISGDVNYTEDGETGSLFDNIECKQDSTDSTVIINSDKKQLDCMLNKLTPKEKDVLVRRFGLGCEEQTLDCIGQMHGCTRERIRQIQNIALNKLKKIYKKEDINCMLDL